MPSWIYRKDDSLELHTAIGAPLRTAIVTLSLAAILLISYLLEGRPDDDAMLALMGFLGGLAALRLVVLIATLSANRRRVVAVRIDSDGITRSGWPIVPWSQVESIRIKYLWGPLAHPRRLHRRARVIQFLTESERRFAGRADSKPRPGLVISVMNYDASLDDVVAAIKSHSNLPIHID